MCGAPASLRTLKAISTVGENIDGHAGAAATSIGRPSGVMAFAATTSPGGRLLSHVEEKPIQDLENAGLGLVQPLPPHQHLDGAPVNVSATSVWPKGWTANRSA